MWPQQPSGPPPGSPSGGHRGQSGQTIASIAAMGVVLILTVVSFAVAHSDNKSSASSPLGPGGGTQLPSYGAAGRNLPSGIPSVDVPSVNVPSVPGGESSDDGPGYTTPDVPEPTTPEGPTLSTTGINNALDEFFWGLLYHDLPRVKAVSCPARRADFDKGTYINGREVYKWHYTYSIPPDQSYVDVPVRVQMRNPSTGAIGGSWNNTWVVELLDTKYYVCGIRK